MLLPVVTLANDRSESDGFAEIAERFRAAHDSAEIEKVAQLVCWKGVDSKTRRSVERHTASEFGRPLASISFEELPADATLEYQQGGVTYRPNLSPIGYFVVAYVADPANPMAAISTRYLLGHKSGGLHIATAAPVVP